MKERGMKYIILSGLWTCSMMLMGLPWALAYKVVPNKPFFCWVMGITLFVNIFTGVYFVMGLGEQDRPETMARDVSPLPDTNSGETPVDTVNYRP